MAISELQIALLGAGVAAVAVVWGYNAWQERKHRQAADKIFKARPEDTLLDGAAPERREPALPETVSAERMEPRLPEPEPMPVAPHEAAGAPQNDPSAPEEELPVTAPSADEAPDEATAGQPGLPGRWADPVADCVLRFSAAEAVPAPAIWAAQSAWAGDLSKTLSWLALDGADWRPVGAEDSGRYREWAVALQLADRRGAISDGELARFFDGVQRVAEQVGARLDLPSRGDAVLHAGKLDQFCAAVDIQFVLHVVEASGGTFAGTKLRGVAEAMGLRLEEDGQFRARDEEGGELFGIGNIGPEKFHYDTLKSLATHGLTLSLDVPRTGDGPAAFDAMLAAGRQLAKTLGGVLVDAQRQPLADPMIQGIRAKTLELQQQMRDAGIAPGSVRALRLFS